MYPLIKLRENSFDKTKRGRTVPGTNAAKVGKTELKTNHNTRQYLNSLDDIVSTRVFKMGEIR